MAKKLEIENRTRSPYIFERFREGPVAGKLIHDHDNDVVIGDMANTPELMASHRAVYSRKVPPPVVLVDAAWPSTLTPAQKVFFDGLVANKSLRVREVTT